MTSDILLQFCVAGVTYGIIYGVVAIGFTIIYNTTGIINFAQGEFLMLGGMTAVTLHRYVPLPVAILGAVVDHDARRRGHRGPLHPLARTAPRCCA